MKIQQGFSIKPQNDTATKEQALKDAAKSYEGYFLDQMVKAMRSTVNREGGVMKPNFAEKIFEQQLDQKYVEGWSEKGGVGLADMIYNQIAERYMGKGQPAPMKGTLPIAPQKSPMGVPGDSLQMKTIQQGAEYRFEVPNPSGGQYEAQMPMAGTILESQQIGEGWNTVKLDHGQGATSELTFPGSLAQIDTGERLEAGQRLGILDPSRPVLAWKLDRT